MTQQHHHRVIPPPGTNPTTTTTTTMETTPRTSKQSTSTSASTTTATSPSPSTTTTMKPPPPVPSALGLLNATSSSSAVGRHILPNATNDLGSNSSLSHFAQGEKKQAKRAANRRSAQLSRKRKKQFIEELKEENDDLRRKELILRAIPDLIVVFDSSGKLGFVSESVGRFINMSPDQLEGTSFWDRLCEDSVRLLKAAFMDSLAARQPESDTAPLGSGVWQLKLADKESNYMDVTLNGVVHFKGDVPECVCCIRPVEQDVIRTGSGKKSATATASAKGTSSKPHLKQQSTKTRLISSSDGSRSSDGSSGNDEQPRVNPAQNVAGRKNDADEDDDDDDDDEDVAREEGAARKRRRMEAANAADGVNEDGETFRISDGDSVGVSESSGSDDGVTSSS